MVPNLGTGKFWLSLDLRTAHQITTPVPPIRLNLEDMFSAVRKCKSLQRLDMCSAYWQGPLAADCLDLMSILSLNSLNYITGIYKAPKCRSSSKPSSYTLLRNWNMLSKRLAGYILHSVKETKLIKYIKGFSKHVACQGRSCSLKTE